MYLTLSCSPVRSRKHTEYVETLLQLLGFHSLRLLRYRSLCLKMIDMLAFIRLHSSPDKLLGAAKKKKRSSFFLG